MSKNLPELQRSVQISANIGKQDYTGAYSQVAQTPSALGQLASDVAQRASNQFSMAMGYKAGENPRGSILPAFTESDKAFVDAYHASAKTTLSLQANKAMQDAQLMLAKEPQLNQGQIDSFASSMTSTFDNMLEMAPDAVKNSLRNSLQSSLDNSVASLQLKLIKQDRQNQISDANLFMQTELENIGNVAQDNYDLAKDLQSSYLNTIQSYVDQHLVSKKTLQSAKDGSTIMLESRRAIGEMKRLMAGLPPTPMAKPEDIPKGGVDEYMANLTKDERIASLPLQQQQAVLSNVVKQYKLEEGLRSQYRSDVYSEGMLKIKNDVMTDSFLVHAQETLKPSQYNSLIASMAHNNINRAKEEQRLNFAIENYNDPSMSLGVKDDVFHLVTQKRIEAAMEGGKMDRVEATIKTISAAGRQDPIFLKGLNHQLENPHPNTFFSSAQEAIGINRNNKNNLQLSDKALNNLIYFQSLKSGNMVGSSDQQILETMLIQQKDDLVNKQFIEESNNQWMRENLSTTNQLDAMAKSVLGIRGSNVTDLALLRPQIRNLFKRYLDMTGGDSVRAQNMIEHRLKNTWSTTYLNGEPHQTFLSPESASGFPEDKNVVPILYNQMATQLEQQLQKTNNDPNSLATYTIVSKPDIEGYFKAKQEYDDFISQTPKEDSNIKFKGKAGRLKIKTSKGQLDIQSKEIVSRNAQAKKLADNYISKLKEIKNAKLEVIENIGGKRTKLFIGTKSPSALDVSIRDTGKVVGEYIMSATDENGIPHPFLGMGLTNHQPVYRINQTETVNTYANLYNINLGENLSTAEKIEQIKKGRETGPFKQFLLDVWDDL